LTKTAVTVTVPIFTSDPAYCPITYSLATQSGSPVDADVVTFDPATRELKYEYLDTTDFATKEAVLNLKIVGASTSQT